MYQETTDGITVQVTPLYLPQQSDPAAGKYLWAYTVVIMNDGPTAVQLLRRHWIITDAMGRAEEVEGPGVVGQQPVLQPGERYEYTSGAPLPTPSGFMGGSYLMRWQDGASLQVRIPTFSLDCPEGKGAVH